MTVQANVTDTVYAAIEDSITHVLMWVNPWQTDNGTSGWDLVTLREYKGGAIEDVPHSPALPEDAPVPDLAEWVRRQLGRPVALYRDTEQIFVVRWPCPRGRLHNPVYWITPAGRA